MCVCVCVCVPGFSVDQAVVGLRLARALVVFRVHPFIQSMWSIQSMRIVILLPGIDFYSFVCRRYLLS